MGYVRLEGDGGEVRWINLDQVGRVTMAMESPDVPIAAVIFSDEHSEDCFKLRGTDETSRNAIQQLRRALDHLCELA